MAQNIALLGAEYLNVPAVTLPTTTGGVAKFIDTSTDTVTPNVLLIGQTAHNANGEAIVGTLKPEVVAPIEYDYVKGYIATGKWTYENTTNNRSDIYSVQGNHAYFLTLGKIVGTRFRAAVLDTNPAGTQGTYTGTQVAEVRNPPAYSSAAFTTTKDGYLVVTKDNTGKSGLKSYLFDITAFIQLIIEDIE